MPRLRFGLVGIASLTLRVGVRSQPRLRFGLVWGRPRWVSTETVKVSAALTLERYFAGKEDGVMAMNAEWRAGSCR